MDVKPINILIIDDSQLVHTLLDKVFAEQGDLVIVGNAYHGEHGVQMAKDLSPHVIIMDINMPRMSGLEAIEEIMAEKPTPIIVFSSASREIIDLSFKAIELGAVDLVEKPAARDLSSLKAVIEEKLIKTIRIFADFKVMRRFNRRSADYHLHAPPALETKPGPVPVPSPRRSEGYRTVGTPEPVARGRPGEFFVIAVASSTGGPQLLRDLFSHPLFATLPAGVVIVQHLAEGFVEGFVDWLGLYSSLPVTIAREGEPLASGAIQVAPAGRHLGIDHRQRFIHINQPPHYGIRPSADVLFDSLGRHLGVRLVALILSGMGSDGARSLPTVKEHGGLVIAQDEESSLIFGMPKAAIDTGLTDAVLNIKDMPDYLARFCLGKAAHHAG